MWPSCDLSRGNLDKATGRSIRDMVDSRDHLIRQAHGPPSDCREAVIHLTSSFPFALARTIRCSIWLVLKTILWLFTLKKREFHFSREGTF